jgi:mannose-6-phosphate isomerase
MKYSLLKLSPNRVRRNYRGGKLLDHMAGVEFPADGNRPEDWIASTVTAVNPGLENIPDEGLSEILTTSGKVLLKDLFAEYGEFYLGRRHLEKSGYDTGFLVKYLDASMRLHIQAHPTASFAQKYLGTRWGKLETYIILEVRDEHPGEILLGFQHAPTEEEWLKIVVEQDMEAMHACFTPVKVKPGEVWVVPGGLPHAIGAGVMVIEVMEPSDLVVRCEFEREGIIVPPRARFMEKEPGFALKIFDYTSYNEDAIRRKCMITPETVSLSECIKEDILISSSQTDCFKIRRLRVSDTVQYDHKNILQIAIVTRGAGTIIGGNEAIEVKPYDRFLIAAAAGSITVSPATADMEMVLCEPNLN